jgi:hypothetical protein
MMPTPKKPQLSMELLFVDNEHSNNIQYASTFTQTQAHQDTLGN